MGISKWLNAVSKCQCEIVRNSTGVFLRDKSSNGNKVSKDNMWPLKHNSEIYFAGSNNKVFVFMSLEATSESYPSKLTTKYTVSKVLEKGACEEFMFGFRVPDLYRVTSKIICNIVTTFNGGDSTSNVLKKVQIL